MSILKLILKLPVMLSILVKKMSLSLVIFSPLENLYLPFSLQTLGWSFLGNKQMQQLMRLQERQHFYLVPLLILVSHLVLNLLL
ncbi:transmembrane protein, putative [Medicago truncatula]|uniref:Transmembrane protein, putative n=1 Tax=Medicago truncatula TaxID=3880 RepID=A0A072TG71_MEDTR|nr:transmembrane protein, putative [Medicago truncatula]